MIRTGCAADARAIASLHAAADPPGWSETSWNDLLRQPATRIHLDCADTGALHGLLALNLAADEAEILMLAVAPGFRRRGIASRLLSHALADASGQGAARAFLEVAADNNAARNLYARAGFITVSSRAGYYARDDRFVDALVLARDLGKHAG